MVHQSLSIPSGTITGASSSTNLRFDTLFQFHQVRLPGRLLGEGIAKATNFQFHQVRLPAVPESGWWQPRCHLSIPSGTITGPVKSALNTLRTSFNSIRYDYRTSHRRQCFPALPFQFHQVRLPANVAFAVLPYVGNFQFHQVRLPVAAVPDHFVVLRLSIPSGTITGACRG